MEGVASDKARDAMAFFLQRILKAPSDRRKVLSSLLLEASQIACRECQIKNCEVCLAVKSGVGKSGK